MPPPWSPRSTSTRSSHGTMDLLSAGCREDGGVRFPYGLRSNWATRLRYWKSPWGRDKVVRLPFSVIDSSPEERRPWKTDEPSLARSATPTCRIPNPSDKSFITAIFEGRDASSWPIHVVVRRRGNSNTSRRPPPPPDPTIQLVHCNNVTGEHNTNPSPSSLDSPTQPQSQP